MKMDKFSQYSARSFLQTGTHALPARSVLLTGTYSCQNKGDAAMQVSTARQLAEQFGDAVGVAMLAPFADADAFFYAPMPVHPCDRRKLVRGTLALRHGAAARKTAAADLVIDLSGDMLTEDYGPHVAWSHFLPLLRAWATGTPYFICAQSIGPFKLTLPIARFLLNRAAGITVRDRISLDYLRAIGIDRAPLIQTADMAFLLEPADRAQSLARIAAAGLNPEAPITGVSVSRLIADRFDRQRGRSPGDFVKGMVNMLARFGEQQQCQFLFTPHVTGPSAIKDDRILSREVAALLPPSLRCGAIDGDLRPEEIKGVIACTDLFVGARMHANIAALSSHVPTLAMAYSHKTPGIMAECGMADYWLDIDTMDWPEFAAKLDALNTNRTMLRDRLVGRIAHQQAEAQRNVALIADVLWPASEKDQTR